MIRILNTAGAPAAIGPYSQGIEANGTVYVSGQLPVDPETGELLQGSIAEQTVRSLRNIEAILAQAGCTMDHVVKTTVLLRDMADFAEMNGAYAAFFKVNPPARACFQVAGLPKNASLEIECVAVKE